MYPEVNTIYYSLQGVNYKPASKLFNMEGQNISPENAIK